MNGLVPQLQFHNTPGAAVVSAAPDAFTLSIPSGSAGKYRWAQADDYLQLPRKNFRWRSPTVFSLRAQVSSNEVCGTWGFGLWNDPFSLSLGLQGMARRLPVLPNAAWFFFAGGPNYLSLCDDRPAEGMLAAVFSSPMLPSWILAPALPAAALLAFKPTARLLRRIARMWVRDEPQVLSLDVTRWHSYRIEIRSRSTLFAVDGSPVLETRLVPRGRLGVVIWIDNQFMRWDPRGAVQMGTLAGPGAVLQVADLECSPAD